MAALVVVPFASIWGRDVLGFWQQAGQGLLAAFASALVLTFARRGPLTVALCAIASAILTYVYMLPLLLIYVLLGGDYGR